MNLLSHDLCNIPFKKIKFFRQTKSYSRQMYSAAIAAGLLGLTSQAQALTCTASADSWGDGYVVSVNVTNDSS